MRLAYSALVRIDLMSEPMPDARALSVADHELSHVGLGDRRNMAWYTEITRVREALATRYWVDSHTARVSAPRGGRGRA